MIFFFGETMNFFFEKQKINDFKLPSYIPSYQHSTYNMAHKNNMTPKIAKKKRIILTMTL